MKRVLLTGAGGFVGHHVLEHFLSRTEWHIIATDSFRHMGKTDRIRQVLDGHPDWQGRVQVLTHDLTVPWSDQSMWEMGQVDYIVNVASESHVDRSITQPVPFIRNNVDLVLNMLELSRHKDPDVFLQVSTDEVYGPMIDGDPHSEWDTVLPSNPYSASKAAQEAICISYWRTYNVPLILTNTMNLIGERQDPEKYLPSLIKNINEGRTVQIHGDLPDIGSRFYLHARSQADALLYLLEHREPRLFDRSNHFAVHEPDRFNVVGEKRIDNLKLAEMVAEVLAKPLDFEMVDFHSTRPGHDPHYGLDGHKLERLGWTPPMAIEESIERSINWTLKHPEWML